MFYISSSTGVDVYKNLHQVKNETSFKKEDFTQLGSDYILHADDDSIAIAKDIKLLETVAAKQMFTKNKMEFADIIGFVTLLLVLLNLVQ